MEWGIFQPIKCSPSKFINSHFRPKIIRDLSCKILTPVIASKTGNLLEFLIGEMCEMQLFDENRLQL